MAVASFPLVLPLSLFSSRRSLLSRWLFAVGSFSLVLRLSSLSRSPLSLCLALVLASSPLSSRGHFASLSRRSFLSLSAIRSQPTSSSLPPTRSRILPSLLLALAFSSLFAFALPLSRLASRSPPLPSLVPLSSALSSPAYFSDRMCAPPLSSLALALPLSGLFLTFSLSPLSFVLGSLLFLSLILCPQPHWPWALAPVAISASSPLFSLSLLALPSSPSLGPSADRAAIRRVSPLIRLFAHPSLSHLSISSSPRSRVHPLLSLALALPSCPLASIASSLTPPSPSAPLVSLLPCPRCYPAHLLFSLLSRCSLSSLGSFRIPLLHASVASPSPLSLLAVPRLSRRLPLPFLRSPLVPRLSRALFMILSASITSLLSRRPSLIGPHLCSPSLSWPSLPAPPSLLSIASQHVPSLLSPLPSLSLPPFPPLSRLFLSSPRLSSSSPVATSLRRRSHPLSRSHLSSPLSPHLLSLSLPLSRNGVLEAREFRSVMNDSEGWDIGRKGGALLSLVPLWSPFLFPLPFLLLHLSLLFSHPLTPFALCHFLILLSPSFSPPSLLFFLPPSLPPFSSSLLFFFSLFFSSLALYPSCSQYPSLPLLVLSPFQVLLPSSPSPSFLISSPFLFSSIPLSQFSSFPLYLSSFFSVYFFFLSISLSFFCLFSLPLFVLPPFPMLFPSSLSPPVS
ncbi:hypothetical protein C7M84_006488 [Penaeus vannamei]|uniref:Uncharacterized protein n=1 Tax=Penaeus vannamei TaxID=6689 RepID=A0A3R7P483_PENVA|nr:hypothetical protein C7M84_006488 [Penaeus vannamei]